MLAQTFSRPGTFYLTRARTTAPVVRRAQQINCSQENERLPVNVNTLMACVATLSVVAQPALAGVQLTSPSASKKSFLVDDSTTEQAQPKKREFKQRGTKSSESSGASLSLPAFSAPSLEGPSLDPRTVALPGALVGIAGIGYLLTTLDPKFGELLQETSVKDSTAEGVGYEPALKAGSVGKAGTKPIKKTSIFGKK